MELKEPRGQLLIQRQNSWKQAKYARPYSDPTPKTFDSCGFSAVRIFISESAVPHRGMVLYLASNRTNRFLSIKLWKSVRGPDEQNISGQFLIPYFPFKTLAHVKFRTPKFEFIWTWLNFFFKASLWLPTVLRKKTACATWDRVQAENTFQTSDSLLSIL